MPPLLLRCLQQPLLVPRLQHRKHRVLLRWLMLCDLCTRETKRRGLQSRLPWRLRLRLRRCPRHHCRLHMVL